MSATWTISNGTLTPNRDALELANFEFFEKSEDDPVITFTFATHPKSTIVKIHASRLALAGGPLGAMVTRDFKEKQTKTVELPAGEEPLIFQTFKAYLYLCPIIAHKIDHPQLIELCLASDRWGLDALFDLCCKYISTTIAKFDVNDVFNLASLIRATDAPSSLKVAFADRVGSSFRSFMGALKGVAPPAAGASQAATQSYFLQGYGQPTPCPSAESLKKKSKSGSVAAGSGRDSVTEGSDDAVSAEISLFWEIFTAPMMLQMVTAMGSAFSAEALDTLLTHSTHIEDDEDLRQVFDACRWEKIDGRTFFSDPRTGSKWGARALRMALASISTASGLQKMVTGMNVKVPWKPQAKAESLQNQFGPFSAFIKVEREGEVGALSVSVIVSSRPYYEDRDRHFPSPKAYGYEVPVRAAVFFSGCVCGKRKLCFGYQERSQNVRHDKEEWKFSMKDSAATLEAWNEEHLPQCTLFIHARVRFLEDAPWDLPGFNRRDPRWRREMHMYERRRRPDFPEPYLD